MKLIIFKYEKIKKKLIYKATYNGILSFYSMFDYY